MLILKLLMLCSFPLQPPSTSKQRSNDAPNLQSLILKSTIEWPLREPTRGTPSNVAPNLKSTILQSKITCCYTEIPYQIYHSEIQVSPAARKYICGSDRF